MTKFSNKLKKPCFWPILDPFSQFWGKKNFSQKIRLFQAQLHMSVQHHANFQKKTNDTIPRKRLDRRTEGRTEGRTDPILQDPSSYHRGSKKSNQQEQMLNQLEELRQSEYMLSWSLDYCIKNTKFYRILCHQIF